MQGVKLSERIRYLHCEDPDGAHGILVLLGNSRHQTKAVDIDTQDDMRFWLTGFRRLEEKQAQAVRPRKLTAV